MIWEKDIKKEMFKIIEECRYKMSNQIISNLDCDIEKIIQSSPVHLRSFVQQIENIRHNLNYIDQNLEILMDLLQYCIDNDGEARHVAMEEEKDD